MPTSARTKFFPHPRQGTRALPYKVLCYRARADRVVRPYTRTPIINCHSETSAHTGRGERTERCRWQRKRGERVAAVKISSVRRKAAQKFWAPQQGHP